MSFLRRAPALKKRNTGPSGPITYDTFGFAGTSVSPTGTITVPSGVTQIVVEVWGSGGGGGGGNAVFYGGGGGGGAYAKITRALSGDAGKTISLSSSLTGGANGFGDNTAVAPYATGAAGSQGSNSVVNASTLTNSFTLTAVGGFGGNGATPSGHGTKGIGGTLPTIGDVKTKGTDGDGGNLGGAGGAAILGDSSNIGGGGGGGGGPGFGTGNGEDGLGGRIIIKFT